MKLKYLLVVVLLILACGCLLTSCEEESPGEPPAHEHAYGAWSETTAPTCGAKGTSTRTCACGASESKSIAATGEHDYGADDLCAVCGAEKAIHETQDPGGDVDSSDSNPLVGGSTDRY